MSAISNIEGNLVYSCAPCFAGLKPSNLFSVPVEAYNEFSLLDEAFLNSKGFYLKVLCRCKKRIQILLYNEYSLKQILLQKDIQEALKFFGYSDCFSVDTMLDTLASRMIASLQTTNCGKCRQFPHEIGLFLGYPVYDVLEYYKTGGEGCIFSGYWKVYSNAEKAEKIFSQYNECKKRFALQIEQGLGLYDLLSA